MWELHREEVFGRQIAFFTSAGDYPVNRVILTENVDPDICGEYDSRKNDRPVMAGHDRCGPGSEIASAASGRFGNIPQCRV
jgi:hypothetical protein